MKDLTDGQAGNRHKETGRCILTDSHRKRERPKISIP